MKNGITTYQNFGAVIPMLFNKEQTEELQKNYNLANKEEIYGFGTNKIILEDPPRRYQNWSMSSRAVQGEKWGRAKGRSPYDCLDHEVLCSLPISKLADKDCIRLTWCTFPKMDEAFQYIAAEKNERGKSIWAYKTVLFTWIKLNKKYEETMQRMWNDSFYLLEVQDYLH